MHYNIIFDFKQINEFLCYNLNGGNMNIIDYIDKYGETSFEEKTITEVDKLIFALLSYVKYDGIVSTMSFTKKTIEEVGRTYFEKYTKKDIKNNIFSIRDAINVLEKIYTKKRYKDLLMYNDVYIGDDSQQFSAVCIELSPRLVFVSFEGTDQLISGWEEDCKMSYKFPVPAQKLAIKYLNKHFTFRDCELIVAGHSKGGNLALVSSMYANFIVKNKIREIYSYDGPGLRDEQFNSNRYKTVKDKYNLIIPNSCIVGLLLKHDVRRIIKSTRRGVMAHHALRWEIKEDDFIDSELSLSSKLFDEGLSTWYNKYNDDKREEFVKYVFEVFRKNNIKSLTEIMQDYTILIKIFKDVKDIDIMVKNMVKDFIKIFIDCNTSYFKAKLSKKDSN